MSTLRWLCAVVGASASLLAQAQGRGTPMEPTREAAPPAAEQPAPFTSMLRTYQPFGDEPVADWREANDTVLRIGGWQAYGREARDAMRAAPAPSPPVQPSQSPPSGATLDNDHEGHHGAQK